MDAVLSVVSGTKADIIAVIRTGLCLDKYKKVPFITRDHRIYQLLTKVFPEKLKYYFILEEGYRKKQEKQEKVREQLIHRQEKIVEEFDKRLEVIRKNKERAAVV